MARFAIKPIVAVAAVGLLGGCATSMDVGPGYYRYDSHIAGSEPRVVKPRGIQYVPAWQPLGREAH